MTDVFHPPEKTDIRVQRNPELEEAQLRQLNADAEYSNSRTIQVQTEIVLTQAQAIRTLAEAQQHGATVYDRRLIVEAVTSNNLALLIPKDRSEDDGERKRKVTVY